MTEDRNYDMGEDTQFDTQHSYEANNSDEILAEVHDPSKSELKPPMWARVAMGTTAGIVLGGAASYMMAHSKNDVLDIDDADGAGNDSGSHLTDLVDDQVKIASCVDDNMSFSQAFAAARAEVGPGGVFEWRGQLYGTYTAEEWDHMSPAQHDQYNDHFAWSHGSSSTHSTHSPSNDGQDMAHNTQPDSQGNTPSNITDGSQVVQQVDPPVTPEDNLEVEVLAVIHDSEDNMNIAGGINADGQVVFFYDIDNDQVFDYAAVDANNDGSFTQDELQDISGQHLTVADMGGFTDGYDGSNNLLAANDGPDYINDACVDDYMA